eukprot:1159640-Pelagomonas_calceolata.AAC.1
MPAAFKALPRENQLLCVPIISRQHTNNRYCLGMHLQDGMSAEGAIHCPCNSSCCQQSMAVARVWGTGWAPRAGRGAGIVLQ